MTPRSTRPRAAKKESPSYEISPRAILQSATRPYAPIPGAPLTRPLRIFTIDPSISRRSGGIATVAVPYEVLDPGPRGALFDIDPSGAPPPLVAEPLDLDDRFLLLQDGLAPSPADGRFHLQMVYAVCSLTYAAFRRALGRDIAWAADTTGEQAGRLRVRPFGFAGKNAYYDRQDRGLTFGYFRAGDRPGGYTVPQGLAFASLSHDIIAHETAHALLDGLRSQFYAPVQPDVMGFHEGFADLVAYFLHFTYPDVVEQAIRNSSGVISHATLLTSLAVEFGYADSLQGKESALRSAVDVEGLAGFDSDLPPAAAGRAGPKLYGRDLEAHDLGSVLVSAVFEAFTTIFRRKTERILAIAGIDRAEAERSRLSGRLVRALSEQASEIAGQFLNVCIRAIDYCPPVDMQIAEYLRALITADAEMVPDDKWGYREALMRSFRRRGIFPNHVGFMTEDALMWQPPSQPVTIPELAFSQLRFDGEPGRAANQRELQRQAQALGAFVTAPRHAAIFHLIAPGAALPKGIEYVSLPRVESIRCARRVGPDGTVVFDQIAEVIQSGTVRRGGTLFDFTGGCTIVIDPFGGVRYVIYKRVDSVERQDCQIAAMRGPLKRYWKRDGQLLVPRPGMLKTLHHAVRGQP